MESNDTIRFRDNALCLVIVCVLLAVALIILAQLIPFVSEVLSANLNDFDL